MKKNLFKIFQSLWLLAMGAYVAVLVFMAVNQHNNAVNQDIGVTWLGVIGLGVLFYFLYLLFRILSAKNKDRAFRKSAIHGAIGLAFCLLALPVTAKAVEIAFKVKGTTAQTQQNTYFIDDYKLFGMVNDYRSSQKLSGVSQDDETCKVAQKRLDSYFWQTNPSIENYKDVCPSCNSLSVAESKDNYDLNSVLKSWEQNNDTLSTLKTKYKYGCVKASGGNVSLIMVDKSTPAAKVVVVTNSDPVVDCVSIASNCNGSSIKARQSQCSKITCCQVGSTWSVFTSTADCTKAQNSIAPNVANPAPAKVTQPSTGSNFYCYDNTLKYSYYTSSGEQCNINNMVSSCKGIVQTTYNMCMKSCLDTANRNGSVCVSEYVSGNATIQDSPDLYKQCENQVDGQMKTCDDACATPYQENSAKCNN